MLKQDCSCHSSSLMAPEVIKDCSSVQVRLDVEQPKTKI